ncbi:YbaB/EbfC family nucleoid-associated protein [Actinosynnema sp. NPDC023587]|uniref:YbaB/EbfC family nucleoid-associated protein n=1 Tax=Actinosynnema sp. NPDC023587 TaxID=3154695 RepID=UPI0034079F0B
MEPRSEITVFQQLKADIDAQLELVRATTAELESRSFEGTSDAGNVRVAVNGQGALLELEITPGVLHGPRPTAVGDQIVRAVAAARARAVETHRERFHPLMPGLFPAEGVDR